MAMLPIINPPDENRREADKRLKALNLFKWETRQALLDNAFLVTAALYPITKAIPHA